MGARQGRAMERERKRKEQRLSGHPSLARYGTVRFGVGGKFIHQETGEVSVILFH